MLKRIVDRVKTAISANDADDAPDRETAIRLATAVLMVDVARADQAFDDAEFEHVLELTQRHFGLDGEAAAELVESAGERADDLVDVHEFTQLLHAHLDEEEKARIVSLLWQVAYADGRLDKYEDSLVLKISDLLYVSRGRVMRLKHDAARAAN